MNCNILPYDSIFPRMPTFSAPDVVTTWALMVESWYGDNIVVTGGITGFRNNSPQWRQCRHSLRHDNFPFQCPTVAQWPDGKPDYREILYTSQGHDSFPSNSFWTVHRPKNIGHFGSHGQPCDSPYHTTGHTTTNAGWSTVPTIYRTALHSAHNTIQNVFWWFRQPVWPRTVKIHVGYHVLKWWWKW